MITKARKGGRERPLNALDHHQKSTTMYTTLYSTCHMPHFLYLLLCIHTYINTHTLTQDHFQYILVKHQHSWKDHPGKEGKHSDHEFLYSTWVGGCQIPYIILHLLPSGNG